MGGGGGGDWSERGCDPLPVRQSRVICHGVMKTWKSTSTGFERYCPPTRIDAKEHRSCADGRASTRHLHGITERAARCDTVKVPAESADAVSR